MDKSSIYKEIISIQPVFGKKMVIFSFDLYSQDDKQTYPGYDMKVCNLDHLGFVKIVWGDKLSSQSYTGGG